MASPRAARVFTCIFALYGISVASVSLGIIIDELAKLKARRAGRASGSVALNKHLGTVNASDELLAKTWSGDAKEKREAVEALSVEEDMLAAKPPSIWCEIAKDMWKTFTCGFFGEMLASVMSLAGVIGTGTLYYWLEVKQRPEVQAGEDGATVVDSLYYAIITGTTIGYGDEYPMTEGGKFFAIFFLPAATLTLCTLVGELATLPFKRRAARMDEMVLKQFGEFLTASELRILTSTGNGKACTKDQYVLQMLLKLGKVEQDDIDAIEDQFDILDKDGNKTLTADDLSAAEQADWASGEGVQIVKSAPQP